MKGTRKALFTGKVSVVTGGTDHFALVKAFDFVNLGGSWIGANNDGISADGAIGVNSHTCEAISMTHDTYIGGQIGPVTGKASNIASGSTQKMSGNAWVAHVGSSSKTWDAPGIAKIGNNYKIPDTKPSWWMGIICSGSPNDWICGIWMGKNGWISLVAIRSSQKAMIFSLILVLICLEWLASW